MNEAKQTAREKLFEAIAGMTDEQAKEFLAFLSESVEFSGELN